MEFTKKDLNKTLWVKPSYLENNRTWYKVDAEGKTLWKIATEIAVKLMWKDKAYYNEFWDSGDYVVVYNAQKIRVTWNKLEQKKYYRYSGYKGNVKTMNLQELLAKNPEKAIWFAVKWMLPKNKLRDRRLKRLKLFAEMSDKYTNLNLQTI